MEEERPIVSKSPTSIIPSGSEDVYNFQNCLSPGFLWTTIKLKIKTRNLQKDRIDIMHHYEQYQRKKQATDDKILFTKSQMEACKREAIKAKNQKNMSAVKSNMREYLMRKKLLGILENNSSAIATIWLKMDTMFSLRSIAIDLQQTLAILKKMTGSFNVSDLERATDGLAAQTDLVKEMEDACNELNTVNFDYDVSDDTLEEELNSIMSSEMDEAISEIEKNITSDELPEKDNNNNKGKQEERPQKAKPKEIEKEIYEFENWGSKKGNLTGITELI